ncbi:MAG: 3-hydroxy-3-methylglutaryl CoA synthase [Chloroflexi bacterium]|nr:3-hydroxy-3-methylglutaryl CoA synthase [Chloroflexota bacterium]
MAGIRSYGAYIPKWRLGKETKGWGGAGEKAIANFDEDSVTLAIAAATDCLTGIDRKEIDGVIFATTSAPFAEGQGAATIATALDLRTDIFTTDTTNVLRAGTTALRTALDSVKSGSAKNVLVLAADVRLAPPKSDTERSIGDGAAALLVSSSHVLAEIEGWHSISERMVDIWRSANDPFVHTGEDRFIADEGYLRLMPAAVKQALANAKATPKDIAKAAYYSANSRLHVEMSRKLGLAAEQVQDPLYGKVGSAGAAFALMLLVGALEEAKPGDRILLAGYGDGADAAVIKATPAMADKPKRRGIKTHVESKAVADDYDGMLQWRELLAKEPARRPPPQPMSVQALWRDQEANLKLYGSKCKACGTVQYPPQRICTRCNAKDQMDDIRLADTRGEIFTYSMDYVAGTPDVPLVVTVINFKGGGRILCMLTDRVVKDVRIGLPVEMTFRKVGIFRDGIHNYFWKAQPIREVTAAAAQPVAAKA